MATTSGGSTHSRALWKFSRSSGGSTRAMRAASSSYSAPCSAVPRRPNPASPARGGALGMVRPASVGPALLFAVACSVLRGPREMGRFVRAMLLGGAAVAVLVLAADVHAGVVGAPDLLASPPIYGYPRAAAAGLLLTPLMALALSLVLLVPG